MTCEDRHRGSAPKTPPAGTNAPKTASASSPATTPGLGSTAKAIAELVGDKEGRPDVTRLPRPPAGFTSAEVEVFAQRAIDIVERGVAPELSGKTASEAFDYVFDGQYPQTTSSSEQANKAAAGAFDWQWAFASRFKVAPASKPRFLSSRWLVETTDGQLSDGSSARILSVSLSVSLEHLVADAEAGDTVNGNGVAADLLHPIVMQRTITIRGARPLGGPEWWPVVGVQATPLFGGKCAPVNGSLLTPAFRAKTLAEDLDRLSDLLTHPKKINVYAASDAGDLQAFVGKYCED